MHLIRDEQQAKGGEKGDLANVSTVCDRTGRSAATCKGSTVEGGNEYGQSEGPIRDE